MNENQAEGCLFLTWALKASLCFIGQGSHKPPCPPDPRSKERARDSSTMPGPVFCLRKKQAGKQKLRSTLPSCNTRHEEEKEKKLEGPGDP